jgi:NAD(P)-dependent dehydrogenase (short-subunit alcohol dehydrogenase family)
MISVNLTGVIFCCQAGGRLMAAQGHGKIINISSVAALVGRNRKLYEATGLAEQAVDYAAAKAGLLGLTRDLAAFLAPHNIQVNAISPGGFRKNQPEAFIQGYSDLTMQGRMGDSQSDLTGAVVFLASPASAHVTAQNLVVDGGFQYFR